MIVFVYFLLPWIDVPPESSARYLHDGLQVWLILRILMVIVRD